MSKISIFLVLVSMSTVLSLPALRVPNLSDANAKILTYEYKILNDGYFYEFTTSNGITKREEGHLKTVVDPETKEIDEVMDVEGFYSFQDPDGKVHQVAYHADENGYVPRAISSVSKQPVVYISSKKPQSKFQNRYKFPYVKIN